MANLPQNQNSISLYPAETEWAVMKQQAIMLVKSGFLPETIKTPEQAMTVMLKGRELGIPAMQAFSHIHVVKGEPTISAELMLALIFKNCPGAVVTFAKTTSETCEINAARTSKDKPTPFSFSMDDAQQAQITGNPSWKKYPSAMLRARCISAMARAMFPDCLMGCSYTPEEMGRVVNETGEPIEVESVVETRSDAQNCPPLQKKPKGRPRVSPKKETRSESISRLAEQHGWSREQVRMYMDVDFECTTPAYLSKDQFEFLTKEVLPKGPKRFITMLEDDVSGTSDPPSVLPGVSGSDGEIEQFLGK